MKPTIKLKPDQTILFIGDSITDAGCKLLAYRPLGFGYVHFAANALLAKYPHLNLNIINSGVSGNTIEDLQRRWQKDCIRHKPDILSILIGVNDLWRQHIESKRLSEAVYLDQFRSIYHHLLSEAKQHCNCQLILAEPFMFCCDDPQNQMFTGLRAYIDVVHKMADEFDAALVPLQSCIDEQIKKVPPDKWSDDSVHPYLWVHAWISQRWLDAAGL
jgi:lysophospholipase L1-like esterase